MKKNFLPYLSTLCGITVYILTASSTSHCYAFGKEKIELEPIVVTSSKIHSEEGYKRIPTKSQDSVVVKEEDALSHFWLASLLRDFSLTDIRTRGPYGVQADISLRGAAFEQNLVLLGGVSLNDPKSGHHNMDLPVTVYDIERIDLTYGAASGTYGSGAFGGAINIIPKKPEEGLLFSFFSSTGYWDFYSGGASVNIPIGEIKSRNSVEWKRSTGYRHETEFDILTTTSHNRLVFEEGELDLFLGYHTKKFGANSFYSDRYPDEEESINTGLLIAKGKIKKDDVNILPTFYWKRLQDKFILDRNRPSFSRNDHTSNLYGGEIDSQFGTDLGNLAFGLGVGNEEISSSSLGNHNRIKNNIFLEYENRILNFLVNSVMRADYYSTFGFEFSPSFGMGYEVFPSLSIRAGACRAFRAPTFTELYYSSPANKGNADLKPERAWTYEAGLDYKPDGMSFSSTFFLRNSENVIDWTRTGSSGVWQVENIGELDMCGIEGLFRLEVDKFVEKSMLKSINLKYTYLQALDKKGITSKYVLEYLKHNISLNLEWELPFGVKDEINLSFKKRIGSEKYFLLNSTFYKGLKLQKGKVLLFIKFSNILNTDYSEQGGIGMPGFSVFARTKVEF